jgi:hypothetical protein
VLFQQQQEDETAKRVLILRHWALRSSLLPEWKQEEEKKVGSPSAAFGFFAFSGVEIAVAKGADC